MKKPLENDHALLVKVNSRVVRNLKKHNIKLAHVIRKALKIESEKLSSKVA